MNARSKELAEVGDTTAFPALIIIASSAGGVTALSDLFDRLPANLPVAVAVVQHVDPERKSRLPEILGRHTAMQVKAAEHGDRIEAGTVYVAPPDYHLMVREGPIFELSHQAQVRFSRPSADHLFESAAEHYPGRVIAVVLTGMGCDGSQGIGAVRRAGGIVIAQEPGTAQYASMPASAVETGEVDHIAPLHEIAGVIVAILDSGDSA